MEGETGRHFASTRWRLIEDLRSPDRARADAARDALHAIYWPAVYGFLRRRGLDRERAEDVTQGFFVEVVLKRGLLERAHRGSGTLRAYLLASLKNYRTDLVRASARRERALRQRAGIERVERGLEADGGEASPEAVFERAWAESILEASVDECAAWHSATGNAAHWLVFEARVLGPLRGAAGPPSYADLSRTLGFATEARAREAAQRAKKRLVATLRRVLEEDGVDLRDGSVRAVLGILATPTA